MWTILEVVGSIPHTFNRLQNHGGSPWTSLEVTLGTVNPLVGGSNPSRGANFKLFGDAGRDPLLVAPSSNRRRTTSRFDDAAQRRRSPAGRPEGRRGRRPRSNPSRGANFKLFGDAGRDPLLVAPSSNRRRTTSRFDDAAPRGRSPAGRPEGRRGRRPRSNPSRGARTTNNLRLFHENLLRDSRR